MNCEIHHAFSSSYFFTRFPVEAPAFLNDIGRTEIQAEVAGET